jgi:hypothetical protein
MTLAEYAEIRDRCQRAGSENNPMKISIWGGVEVTGYELEPLKSSLLFVTTVAPVADDAEAQPAPRVQPQEFSAIPIASIIKIEITAPV